MMSFHMYLLDDLARCICVYIYSMVCSEILVGNNFCVFTVKKYTLWLHFLVQCSPVTYPQKLMHVKFTFWRLDSYPSKISCLVIIILVNCGFSKNMIHMVTYLLHNKLWSTYSPTSLYIYVQAVQDGGGEVCWTNVDLVNKDLIYVLGNFDSSPFKKIAGNAR